MNCDQVPAVRRVLLLAVVLLTVGCGGSQPRGEPISGKVVFKGKPGRLDLLARGRVRFQSETDPSLLVAGVIEEDGSFAVGAFSEGKALDRIPAGRYKVRIDLPPDDDGNPLRGLIHPKYQDFNKSGLTVTVPPPGEVVLEVERPGG
jgi:hypothetical protein